MATVRGSVYRDNYVEDDYMRRMLIEGQRRNFGFPEDTRTFEQKERDHAIGMLELKLTLAIAKAKERNQPPKPIITDAQALQRFDDKRAQLRTEIERLEALGEDYDMILLDYWAATMGGDGIKRRVNEKADA